jgi:hypothetical protein
VDDVFGIDCVNDDSDPRDDHFHGTHVAGTIGARGNNARGVVGVNWNVGLMALKFLDAQGSGFTSDAIECLEYATRMRAEFGIDVRLTSNSWGGGGFDAALRDAIAASSDAGMLFVAAAGNDASDNDGPLPAFPASYDLPQVVAVAATDHDDALAAFSNFGHTAVDLGAPGVDILSTFPGNSFEILSGTSMATPHVSGAAALVWAASPNLEPLQVKHLLMDTGDAKPSLAELTVSGRRLNVGNALHCGTTFTMNLGDGFRVRELRPVTIEAGLRDCGVAFPGASVSVTTPDGVFAAKDDGLAPDTVADDGTYTTSWIPQSRGAATLVVDAQTGTETFRQSASGTVVVEILYRSESVPFRPVDTSAGTDAGLLHFDDAFVEIPIGFSFTFFGESHERVRISTNGFLAFGSEAFAFENAPMPSSNEPNGVIAPYWDDLFPVVRGSIRYLLEGEAPARRLTVEWSQVPYFDLEDATSTATFQVTLHEGGRIQFQYLDVESGARGRGASATVGVESADGESALLHSFNQPSLRNGTALVIRQAAECNDGRDNDGDGLVDFPADPGCARGFDASETPRSCGLLGIEPLLVAAFVWRWRRRGRAA